jgi:hypothetical protein
MSGFERFYRAVEPPEVEDRSASLFVLTRCHGGEVIEVLAVSENVLGILETAEHINKSQDAILPDNDEIVWRMTGDQSFVIRGVPRYRPCEYEVEEFRRGRSWREIPELFLPVTVQREDAQLDLFES